ncbi:MAG TPA: trypsin-like peptidase domain-containing protein [Thermoanaerobaculia bacterium]|nr:trypsin-like peptidase domain-containing protein [Thermoanaerobaculia bacterium]
MTKACCDNPTTAQTTLQSVADWIQLLSPGIARAFAAELSRASSDSPTASLDTRYVAAQAVVRALDSITVGGSPIVPFPRYLIETVRISNQIVSFVLDGLTHFGTGVLVGPSSVLTAAHLFFDAGGQLIDRGRLSRITVEAHTTLLGDFIMQGKRRTVRLSGIDSNQWLIDPKMENDLAQRDVDLLDFAIVRLDEPLGYDPVGPEHRGWFVIPSAPQCRVLTSNLGIRVFQFLDREELLTSAGIIHNVVENGYRALHTASTASSASGAALADAQGSLVAIHIAGAATGERPKLNRALPIRRVAEIIDWQPERGVTIRSLLD